MKLKQKSYLLSALLVSGVLYLCVLFLTLPNISSMLASVRTRALGEEKALAQALDGLMRETEPSHRAAIAARFSAYDGGDASFSVGTDSETWVEMTPSLSTEPGTVTWVTQNGRTWLYVTDRISDGIRLCYRLDATDAVRRATRQAFAAVLLCTALSCMLTVVLYIMTERVNRPIDRLAHELRTPLTVIRGYGELLERARLTPEQQQSAAGYIVSESERLGAISEKLLTMSDARAHAYRPERIDLAAMGEHLKQTYPTLETEIGWETLTGDRALLLSMLGNLIGNAVKASAPGAKVVLRAEPGVIEIIDCGRGMTREQLTYVNDPAHVKNPNVRSGLGVPLCHEIASLHRAALRFASEEGKGTTATIRFTAP